MSGAVVVAWLVTCASAAWHGRPVDPSFARPLFDHVPQRPTRSSPPRRGSITVRAADAVGRALHERVPLLSGVPVAVLGGATIAGASLLAISPVWALAVFVSVSALGWRAQRAAVERRRRRLQRELPVAIDLLRLALDAGLTVRLAVGRLADHLRGPLTDDLRRVVVELDRGEPLVAALERLGSRLGAPADELTRMLASAERSGAALGPSLDRLAAELRRRRRVSAEERARRLPVLLLMPLVACVLPAFVIVAVVPMLVTGAASFAFPSP